ncbi:ABC transporter ATP-binding protein [Umboniibacter marinipuniceus]|uniref:Iron(III) transport system ATP-binding protein n=1 Tax=Umboniibacter marinipuniceus TaxID=569599 RepID=A0A3M0AQY7_9GAMM|nr:ABC transporter ATP-binding protein [Umboniibacter marinipuniceus]RMA81412.1 iron(III) transport system ATP-binding protein [Umboniibacter marinipuniceus]
MIEIANLSKRYDALMVLEQVSLDIHAGEIVALVGSSGSGKSTLLRVIAGLTDIDAGSVTINQKLVLNEQTSLPPEERNVGLIFQDHALFPHLDVYHNISFSGVSSQQEIETIARQLQIDGLLKRFPHELSGGQQQRVAIARSIAAKPSVLLFDEPFASLDESLKHALLSELQQLIKARNMTAIFVTHNHREAFALADRVAFLHQGSLAQVDTPEKIFTQPSTEACAEFFSRGHWLTETELQHLDGGSYSNGRYFLRPDALSLSVDVVDGTRTTPVTVKSKTYLAPGYQYEVATDNIEIKNLRVNSHTELKIGQVAHLIIFSERLLPFIG